jgi:hypothetical protein
MAYYRQAVLALSKSFRATRRADVRVYLGVKKLPIVRASDIDEAHEPRAISPTFVGRR